MLSKSLSTSEKFAALVHRTPELFEFCHALYPLMVSHTDDFGRLQGDPFTIKHVCYPASPRTLDEFADGLRAMHEVELVIWYAVGGKKYLQIQQFESHQSGLHKRTRSSFPRVPDNSGNPPEDFVHARFPEIPGQLKGTQENLTKGNLTKENKNSSVKTLIDYYSDGYLQRFGERPHIHGAKDGTILKALLVTAKTPEAVKARIDRMLDSTDDFIAKSGRTIGILQACWNKLAPQKSKTPRAMCQGRHVPPCADDAECTRRRVSEQQRGVRA